MDTLPLCVVSLTWVRKPDYSAVIDVACDVWLLFNGQELLCIPSPPLYVMSTILQHLSVPLSTRQL